jgi:Metal binding domain of Ada
VKAAKRSRDKASKAGRTYYLMDRNGVRYESAVPGILGGHRRQKGYGRLDCPAALYWIAKGHYVRYRVFFADEATAIAAGYRPCARCLPERYKLWRTNPSTFATRVRELAVIGTISQV